MTSEGKLTKEEIKSLNIEVKRDTNAVRIKGAGEIEDQFVETELDVGNPAGREHGWFGIALAALIEALESILQSKQDDEPEPEAKAK